VNQVKIGVLGASGYTGAELLRLLANHPYARIEVLTADRQAGQPIGNVFPQLAFGSWASTLPDLISVGEVKSWSGLDVVFCCLPHGTTQDIISSLPLSDVRCVDLSADFRLSDIDIYAEWYGAEHRAPALQKTAVYGLTEVKRDAVRTARLVANPGCYPTASQLPLIPLLAANLIEGDDIIIDAKSGATGAGRAAKQGTLFCEVTEGIHAYGVGSHRHMPEIEQGLSEAAGKPVVVSFTPHLVPMSRGILTTMYVRLSNGATVDDLHACLHKQYAEEPFVHVLPTGSTPHTRHVRGSNHCVIGVVPDRLNNRAIVVSAIDNIVKGASGQAIQNMNLMLDLPETTGLIQLSPVFP